MDKPSFCLCDLYNMMLLWVEGFKKLLLSCSNRFKEVVKQEGGELIYSSSLWPFSIVYTVNLNSLSLSLCKGGLL